MNRNIIIDALPYSVTIDGNEIEIDTDFRTMMMTELLLQDPDVSKEDKGAQALFNFYKNRVPIYNLKEAGKWFLWFYRCGEPEETSGRSSGTQGRNKRIYDFDYDAPMIYSAFFSQYGIDLQEVEDLHWWKFKALFNSLKDTLFNEIMQCRAVKITKGMSKEQKSYYQRMTDLYRLPTGKAKSEVKKEKDLIEALRNGDIEAVERLKRGG